jgi:anti-sigma factor RsiW
MFLFRKHLPTHPVCAWNGLTLKRVHARLRRALEKPVMVRAAATSMIGALRSTHPAIILRSRAIDIRRSGAYRVS